MCSNIMCFKLLIPLIIISILQMTISDHTYNKHVCDWDEFYELYLTVQERRSDLPIYEVHSAGTIDVRKYSGVLCINGPAFLHKEVNNTVPNKKVYYVDPAEIKVFENECLTFNLRDQAAYSSPLTVMDESTSITGTRIYFVTLFGDSDDYRMPSKDFYYDPKFGYLQPSDDKVTSASFAFMVVPNDKLFTGARPDPVPAVLPATGTTQPPQPFRTLTDNPKAYCLSIDKLRINITFVPSPLAGADDYTGFVCTVKEPYADPEMGKLFDANLTKGDYEWYDCPPGDYGIIPISTDHNISQLIDFRIIDPADLTSMGTPGKKPKPGYPGYNLPSSRGYKPPTYSNFPYPGYYFPNDPNYPQPPSTLNGSLPPFTNIRYDATECEPEIPKPEDSCGGDNDNVCKYLDHVMGSAKTDWHAPLKADGTPDTATAPDPPPYDDRQKGAWRIQVLNLVEDIFSEACPQVSPMLAPAVTRIMEYYLLESLRDTTASYLANWTEPNAKTPWLPATNALVADLEECKNSVNNNTRLDFRRVRNQDTLLEIKLLEDKLTDTTLTPKEFSELQSKLQQKKFRFPFDVKVIKDGNQPHNIAYHKESAEIEYDFNLAIDLHWKIFNTVLGYCGLPLRVRTPDFRTILYTKYNDDIFSFVKKKWLNADETDTDNEVFKQLFGAFIYGGASIYLESCMEGAYIATNTANMRELRDVPLRELQANTLQGRSGDPNAAVPIPFLNFFTYMPDYNADTQYSSTNK